MLDLQVLITSDQATGGKGLAGRALAEPVAPLEHWRSQWHPSPSLGYVPPEFPDDLNNLEVARRRGELFAIAKLFFAFVGRPSCAHRLEWMDCDDSIPSPTLSRGGEGVTIRLLPQPSPGRGGSLERGVVRWGLESEDGWMRRFLSIAFLGW